MQHLTMEDIFKMSADEMLMIGDDIAEQLENLEDAISECDYGSYAYDQLDMEIQDLSLKLRRIMTEVAARIGT